MTPRAEAFDDLLAGLRGTARATVDWQAIIGLANHTLLTPSLHAALLRSGQIDALPGDARDYLRFVATCNRERNIRLRAQLLEAVAAFNAAGITPVLLKGGVPLYLAAEGRVPDRITSDLDVAVEPSDMAGALACLEALGYAPADNFRGMARPQDVGLFELRPSKAGVIDPAVERVEREGRYALIPSADARAEHWLLHDLVKEGDLIRGRIDLRHLYDLAELTEQAGVDWRRLRAAMPDRASRRALDVQLYAMQALFGIEVPQAGPQPLSIRLHHWRRTFPARHPVLGAPLRVSGNFVWGLRRLSRLPALGRSGPVEAARRVLRLVFEQRPRAKL